MNELLDYGPLGLQKPLRVILTPGERSTVREDQSVTEMAHEVLMRQAKVRAERSGDPIEEAVEAVLNTEAGAQLRDLRDGPHGEESVEEAQVGVARERAQERVEDLGKRLGGPLSSPRTVNGTNFRELR